MAPKESLTRRLIKFAAVLGCSLIFVYGVLPMVTTAFEPLDQMSAFLDDSGIDPTRYFYTDVEQVLESEQHLNLVLK